MTENYLKPTKSLMRLFGFLLLSLFLCCLCGMTARAEQITVGSKKFTESYVLGEIAKKLLQDASFTVDHKQGIGATGIVWEALKGGSIDLYPEYTGTVSEELLKSKRKLTADEMRTALRPLGVGMTNELGFNNTYALVIRKDTADKLQLKTISDLKNHPELRVGITNEFYKRADGWSPLVARYGLQMSDIRQLDHGLGYSALVSNQIDITDAYSTDAKIAQEHLVVLQDDLNFFPQYKAVFLYRLTIPVRALDAIRGLEGKLDDRRMTELNAFAEDKKNYAAAAKEYFRSAPSLPVAGTAVKSGGAVKSTTSSVESEPSQAAYIFKLLRQHLFLVGISLFLAILVGIPLGIAASRPGPVSQVIFAVVGIIQTIPSLALLALLVPIPHLGIGVQTAILALFLYSLLPIVRNTAVGLQDIPGPLRESATALGLEPSAQLTKILLPMASRTILAGIKTSAIINVGTATLAALIGAGGLGEPIVSGLSLVDNKTILQGAIPAAILALLVQFGFDLLDKMLIPKGLRLPAKTE